MAINLKRNIEDIDESLRRADAVSAARKIGKMLVTEESEGADDPPEKILLDVASMSPLEMLAKYKAYMADFDTLPIDPAGDHVRIFRGEWSIWSGYPGNGKTTFLRQMCLHFLKCMKNGECVFVATLEQDPTWYIIEMAGTAAGVETPTEEHVTAFLDTYGDKLKVWGMIGVAEHRKIFATVRELAEKHGCKHAIIDSLMALDIDSGDYEAQRKFANMVSATARAKGVHIHLVAHPRKPIAADQAPNTWDVAGSSDLGRLAFNVFFVRRGPQVAGFEDISAMLFYTLKQRTRGTVGEQTAYFYRKHRQFHIDQFATEPTHYLPDSSYPPTGMSEEIPAHLMNPGAFKVEPQPYGSNPWDV
jgi:KaiC/GvpD/RAD55 family RecA-like ATPase